MDLLRFELVELKLLLPYRTKEATHSSFVLHFGFLM